VWYKFTEISGVLAASIIGEIALVNFYQTARRRNPEDSYLQRLRAFEKNIWTKDRRRRSNRRFQKFI
jgi:hypothetical protein